MAALSDEELARVCLGAGRWILLEPAPGPLGDTLLRHIEALGERGHRCLVAHPERHLSEDMFERMAALVAAGALIQATADFFLREQMAAGMAAMAAAGLVHVLSSDSHSSTSGRPLRLAPALARLGEIEAVAPHLEWIAETAPRAIAGGEPLGEPPFAPRL